MHSFRLLIPNLAHPGEFWTFNTKCRVILFLIKIPISRNFRCYQFYSIFEEYLYAEQQCNALGGNLASIQNAYANNLLLGKSFTREKSNLLFLEHADDYFTSRNATDFWIGLNDLMVPDQWVWTDNSSTNYLNWAPGLVLFG